MNDLSGRLKRSAKVLDELGRKRDDNTMTPEDYQAENRILMTELRELEEDLACEPGPLRAYLTPVRRRRVKRIEPK
jgi:hypothetical protein